ncbi:MAG: glycoside hydrolase family 3 C-terminal domain-containing protein [Lachnospiraceae bacterium]|nr:glycoside hydrolase family 3 C-terminal domain-containing protein [Lachnospiraceae bacterium]
MLRKMSLEELWERLPETEIVYAYGYPIVGNDESGHEAALAAIAEADLCILTLGGKYGSCSVASMGEGVDGANINLPECQETFIRKTVKLGKPLVGVHFNGRPISSDAADECLNAILEAWNPSEAGAQAIVDVLTGVYNPSGKMPLSVAYHTGQVPIYYNHPNGSAWHQGGKHWFCELRGFAAYTAVLFRTARPGSRRTA